MLRVNLDKRFSVSTCRAVVCCVVNAAEEGKRLAASVPPTCFGHCSLLGLGL